MRDNNSAMVAENLLYSGVLREPMRDNNAFSFSR
jgi:hypothetical protein